MEAELNRLSASIAGLTDVVTGAEALLDTLSDLIRNLPSTNPADAAQITALADAVDAKKAELAANIAKNTPAAPPPDTTGGNP